LPSRFASFHSFTATRPGCAALEIEAYAKLPCSLKAIHAGEMNDAERRPGNLDAAAVRQSAEALRRIQERLSNQHAC
jgi:hypothetical protein